MHLQQHRLSNLDVNEFFKLVRIDSITPHPHVYCEYHTSAMSSENSRADTHLCKLRVTPAARFHTCAIIIWR